MGARTDAARAEVVAARRDLTAQYEQLGKSTREAVDVPARIRKAPAQTAALAGGAAFIALGGPRRVARRVRRAVFGAPTPLPKSLLPDEVERAVRALGTDGDAVRGALERSFADYLEQHTNVLERGIKKATSDAVASTIRLTGRAAGITFARRLLAGERPDVTGAFDQARRIIQRGTTGTPGTPGGAYGEATPGLRTGGPGPAKADANRKADTKGKADTAS